MCSGKALWSALSVLVLAGLAWPASFSCSFPYSLSGSSNMFIQSDVQLTPALSLPAGASACAGSEFSPGMSLSYGWHQSQYDAQLVSHATSSTCLTPYSSQPSNNAIHWLPASSFSKMDSSGGISFASMQDFQNYMAGLPTGGITIASKYIDPFDSPFGGGQTYQSDVALYCKGTLYLVSDTPGFPYSAVVMQDYSASGNGGAVVASYQKPVLPSNLDSVTFRLRFDVTGCSASGRTYTFKQTPACQYSPDGTWIYGRCSAVSSGLSTYSQPLVVSVGTPFACADLPVSGPSVSNPNPAAGSQVSFGFTLTNDRSKEIEITTITLAPSSISAGFSGLSASPVPSTIAVGQPRAFTGTVTVPSSAGNKALRLSIAYRPTSADCSGSTPLCNMTETQIVTINVIPSGQPQKPDYVPLITAPQNATVGVPFSVSIITRNIGAGNATNSSTTRAAFESAVSDFAVAPLASDAQQANTATFNCTSTGAKAISVTVDLKNGVDESNESNNFASATVDCVQQPGGQPNYVPLLPASQSATVGQPFFVSVTTRNIGDAAATAATTTRVRFESSSTNLSIAPLAAGAQDARAVSFTCQSPGAKQLNATVDATGAQPESNEGDNFASMTINCQAAPLPDYIPFITAPPNATVGVPFSATITTRNIGNGNATNSSVTRATFESAVSSFQVAPLTAGAQQADAAQFTCTSAGQKTISASADFGNSISESNEANNAASATVNCLAPAGFSLACSLVGHDSLFYPNESAQVRADCLSNGQPTACPALNWSTDISGAAVSPTFTGAGPTPQSSTFYSPATQPSSITNGQVAIRCANPLDCSATCSVSLSVSPRPDFMVCSLSVPRPGPPYQFLPSDNSPVSAECTWNFVPAACPALNWGTTVTGGSIAPSSTPRQPSPSVTFFTSGAPVQSGRTIGASSAEPDTPLYCAALIQVNVVSAIGPDYVVSAMRKPSLMVEVGRTFEVEADVSNIGNRNATDNSLVHFDAGCVPADQQDAPLLVGQARTHIATCTCSRAGIMPITANADYYGSVTEYDENNNARTVQVQCGSTFAPMCADYV